MEMKLEEGLASKLKVPKGKRDSTVFDMGDAWLRPAQVRPAGRLNGVSFSVNGTCGEGYVYDATIKGVPGAQGGGRREGEGRRRCAGAARPGQGDQVAEERRAGTHPSRPRRP